MSDADQRVSGDSNVVAGRDIEIHQHHRKQLVDEFHDELTARDARINAVIAGGVLAPTKGNASEVFSSEHMILSLASLGIPVEVGLRIIDVMEERLAPLVAAKETITTAHLRKVVSAALYSLDIARGVVNPTHLWGDLYARRYGNPNERIRVIEIDGDETNLDYHFLKTVLIPELVEQIVGSDYVQSGKIIGSAAVDEMAAEIMTYARGLNLYAIRHSTLKQLAYDIAIQPPHPWFVGSKSIATTVEYDLNRVDGHVATLSKLFANGDVAGTRHAALECIHHAASAILAFYGAFLGCGFLAPLYQLTHMLNMSTGDGSPVLWDFCRIKQIEGDLQPLKLTTTTMLRDLKRIAKEVRHPGQEGLPHLLKSAQFMSNVAHGLITERRVRVDERLALDDVELSASGDWPLLCRDVLARVPRCRIEANSEAAAEFWLTHNIHTVVFSEVKARILVIPISRVLVTVEDLEEGIALAGASIMMDWSFANTAVIIACGDYAKGAIAVARGRMAKHIRLVPLSVAHLRDLHEAKNRARKFEELLLAAAARSY